MKVVPYIETFTVRHGEAGRTGKLRTDSFFDAMQEVASNNAEKLGIGYVRLAEKQMLWVLSRMKLAVKRAPLHGETFLLKTWASGMDKIFATREFEFTAQKTGEVLAVASSRWLMIDSVSFRPKRIREEFPGILPDDNEMPRYFDAIDKIQPSPSAQPIQFTVMESQIDINQHLNNARCTAMLCDWLARNGCGIEPPAEIQVNFQLATPSGTDLAVTGNVSQDRSFYVECSGGNPVKLRFHACGRFA